MNTVRLWLILITAAAIVSLRQGASMAADESDWQKQTVTYKTVGSTKIQADVYCRNGSQPRPAVVWIHGGALIMGNREGVPRDIVALCRDKNYILISIDYRLAPQVKLPEIIDDLKDAFRWLHGEGANAFHIDTSKIVVSGGSAGGYLTMMTGICVNPRPTALVAYWGYGDVDGPWYTEPSAHYRQEPLVSRDEAYSAAGSEVTTGPGQPDRRKYYLYLRQNGLWTREVSGFDPATQRKKLDPFCPVRSLTPDYPPILMIHGTADTDVPYQESADMAAALEKQALPHELITVPGGGHGLGGGDKQVIADANARALAFIRQSLD